MVKKIIKKHALNAILLACSIIFIIIASSIFWAATLEMPELDNFESRAIANSTKIYDRTGKTVLYNIGDNIKRTKIPFEDISPYIVKASISIEDAYYYEHFGFRPQSFVRALIANAQTGRFGQGGSTITQQVVKNALLTRDKTVTRKIKEIILAIRLDYRVEKNKILEIYLNESPYGGTIYGVEEASLAYFGKNAKDVTLTEAAYLASLPQSPTYYSPYGKNREALEKRKNLVLERMFELGHITEDEKLASQKESIEFKKGSTLSGRGLHFIMYIREYLEEKYGKDIVQNGGLHVISTLDYSLQKDLEEVVYNGAIENTRKFGATNAALVAIDPNNGHILSMVGSRDFQDTEIDGQFNVALAQRQPGSSFKPIVYALAFSKGYTPETVLFDVPTNFSTRCDAFGNPINGTDVNCYMPVNYDGIFRGPISLRESLAQSLNIPAVKLLYLTGIADAVKFATKLGLTTINDPNRYGLTLVLGGGEVTLLEMTGAYSVFANGGVYNKPVSIIEIRDGDGNILETNKGNGERVIDENVASLVSSVLSDNVSRTPAFGATSPLYFGSRPVAVKTGTTNDYKDVWTIGYTPQIAIGMWGGNNDSTPIDKRAAGSVISPVWRNAMLRALKDKPVEYFKDPEPNQSDKPILRGEWCTSNGAHDILHFVSRYDPTGPAPVNPSSDSQYSLWEIPTQKWLIENGGCGYVENNSTSTIIVDPSMSTSTTVTPPGFIDSANVIVTPPPVTEPNVLNNPL